MPAIVTDYTSLELSAQTGGCLSSTWLRSVSSQEYRMALLQQQEIILQHEVKYWLIDSRALSGITFPDQQWLGRQLIPVLLQSKLRKVARVVNTDVFTYIAFEEQIRKVKRKYNFKTAIEQFSSPEAAKNWLYL